MREVFIKLRRNFLFCNFFLIADTYNQLNIICKFSNINAPCPYVGKAFIQRSSNKRRLSILEGALKRRGRLLEDLRYRIFALCFFRSYLAYIGRNAFYEGFAGITVRVFKRDVSLHSASICLNGALEFFLVIPKHRRIVAYLMKKTHLFFGKTHLRVFAK